MNPEVMMRQILFLSIVFWSALFMALWENQNPSVFLAMYESINA